jgi:hypothetical protein
LTFLTSTLWNIEATYFSEFLSIRVCVQSFPDDWIYLTGLGGEYHIPQCCGLPSTSDQEAQEASVPHHGDVNFDHLVKVVFPSVLPLWLVSVSGKILERAVPAPHPSHPLPLVSAGIDALLTAPSIPVSHGKEERFLLPTDLLSFCVSAYLEITSWFNGL